VDAGHQRAEVPLLAGGAQQEPQQGRVLERHDQVALAEREDERDEVERRTEGVQHLLPGESREVAPL
jgi:hypothetical protein